MPKTSQHHTQTAWGLLPSTLLRSQPAYQMSFKCSCYLWLSINSLYKSLADVFVTAILFHIHRLVYVYVCICVLERGSCMNYMYSRCYCLPLSLEPGLYITGVAISFQFRHRWKYFYSLTHPQKGKATRSAKVYWTNNKNNSWMRILTIK